MSEGGGVQLSDVWLRVRLRCRASARCKAIIIILTTDNQLAKELEANTDELASAVSFAGQSCAAAGCWRRLQAISIRGK